MVNCRNNGTPWSRPRLVFHLPLLLPICSVCQRFAKLKCVSPMVTFRLLVFTCFGLFLFTDRFFLFLNVSFTFPIQRGYYIEFYNFSPIRSLSFSLNVIHCEKRHTGKQEVFDVIIFYLLFNIHMPFNKFKKSDSLKVIFWLHTFGFLNLWSHLNLHLLLLM